jgi:hypothetical protein
LFTEAPLRSAQSDRALRYTALNWAIDFKINVQQRDMDRAKKQVQARDQSHAQRRGSLQPGLLPATKEPSWAKRKSAPDVLK